MKNLFRLLTFVAVGACLLSCNKDEHMSLKKPVLTADMFAVTADAESGEVVFKYKADGMAFWTVSDPYGIKATFNGSEVAKTYKSRGTYTGSIIAYGTNGQSDPVQFEFYIERDDQLNPVVDALSGKTLHVAKYGWWGEGWEYFEEYIDEYVADDTITFGADGTLTINLGETQHIYNDGVPGGEDYVIEGPGKWALVMEGDTVLLQFSDGGFPLMLAGSGGSPEDPNYHLGMDAMWTVTSIDEDGTVRMDIYQAFNEQWFTVFLTPVE